jgi:hypothetical protein
VAEVVFVCNRDWANVGWIFQESMASVGVPSVSLRTGPPHPFGYPQEARHVNISLLQQEIDKASSVMFMHSQWPGDLNIEGKRVAVFHGGSQYRNDPKRWNVFWNPKVDVSVIQTANLLDRGAKNQVWVMPSVDTDQIVPTKRFDGNKLRIAHFPRKASMKGSHRFLNAMEPHTSKSNIVFRYQNKICTWKKNIERMEWCDVYLESQEYFRSGPNGDKLIGVWGITAMEAASLGKIVVTCFSERERYEKTFGKCPILGANSEIELKKVLEQLFQMSRKEIVALQETHRKWAVRCHSRIAVGNRLQKEVF